MSYRVFWSPKRSRPASISHTPPASTPERGIGRRRSLPPLRVRILGISLRQPAICGRVTLAYEMAKILGNTLESQHPVASCPVSPPTRELCYVLSVPWSDFPVTAGIGSGTPKGNVIRLFQFVWIRVGFERKPCWQSVAPVLKFRGQTLSEFLQPENRAAFAPRPAGVGVS